MAAVGQPQQGMSMGPAPVPAGITREQIQQTYTVSLLSSAYHMRRVASHNPSTL